MTGWSQKPNWESVTVGFANYEEHRRHSDAGHRVVKLSIVVSPQLAKRSALDVLDGVTLDFIRQRFGRILTVEMDCQNIFARVILFDTNTRHAWFA